MRCTRPEMSHRVRELSTFFNGPTEEHMKAMKHAMNHSLTNPTRGWFLAPIGTWDGIDTEFLLKVKGKADSDHAKNPDNRKSVSGGSTFLQGAPVVVRSRHRILWIAT